MRTRFLTQDSARIDLMFCHIKGFSFRIFEDDRWPSKINFSLFSQQNLTLKYSFNVKMSLEAKGNNRFKDCGVQTIQLLEKPKNDLHRRRTSQFIGKNWAWPLDLTLHLQSMAQMKCLDVNRCCWSPFSILLGLKPTFSLFSISLIYSHHHVHYLVT